MQGTLQGNGTIAGNVQNGGVIQPGTSTGPGILTVTGNYSQFAGGALNLNIGGLTAGSLFDQLAVGGSATLGGTVNVSLASGYTPNIADSYQVVTFASRSGDFQTYNGQSAGNGHVFAPTFDPTDLTLSVAVAAIRVSPTTGLVTSKQGDQTSFTVALATQPGANVTVNVTSSNPGEGTVSSGALTFTPTNWSIPQTITVTGVNDGQAGSVPYSVSVGPAVSADPNYNGLQAVPVTLTNLPNETGDLQVSNVAINPNKGATLVSQPTYDAVHDFSVAANPNGQWSYLNTNAGVTAPLTNDVSITSGLEGWQNQGAVVPNATTIWHNTTNANVNYLTICDAA